MAKRVELELSGLPGKQSGIPLDITTEKEDWNVYIDTKHRIRIKVKVVVKNAVFFDKLPKNPNGEPPVYVGHQVIVHAEEMDDDEDVSADIILKP